MPSKRFEEIVYLRGLGILFVVMIHVSAFLVKVKEFNMLAFTLVLVNSFSQPALALFVFISGFVLKKNYDRGYSLWSYYKKRIMSVIPPYVLFSIVYTLYYQRAFNLRLLLQNLLIWDEYAYHMWFIPMLFMLYLFYPLVVDLYNKFKQRNHVSKLLAGFLIIHLVLNTYFYTQSQTTFYPGILAFEFFLLYFVFGIYAGDNYHAIKEHLMEIKTSLLLLVSCTFTFVYSIPTIIALKAGYTFYQIPTYYRLGNIFLEPIYYIIVFALFLNVSNILLEKKSLLVKAVKNTGQLSYGIYLVHVLMLSLAEKKLLLSGLEYNSWIVYPLLYIATILSAYAIVKIISSIPYGEYLVGRER